MIFCPITVKNACYKTHNETEYRVMHPELNQEHQESFEKEGMNQIGEADTPVKRDKFYGGGYQKRQTMKPYSEEIYQ